MESLKGLAFFWELTENWFSVWLFGRKKVVRKSLAKKFKSESVLKWMDKFCWVKSSSSDLFIGWKVVQAFWKITVFRCYRRKCFDGSDNNKMKPNGEKWDVPMSKSLGMKERRIIIREAWKARNFFQLRFTASSRLVIVTRLRNCEFFRPWGDVQRFSTSAFLTSFSFNSCNRWENHIWFWQYNFQK